tara:strand:- start:10832 stop:11950 length:1119 start_codon:yes stop_codon:yes gene_type:complete
LVRLWPFAPRRTRGNGALSAVIELNSNSHLTLRKECEVWFDELLEKSNSLDLETTPSSPVLIISDLNAPSKWYRDAVTGFVELESRLDEIEEAGMTLLSGKRKWGAIGASSAVAWSPKKNSTWELVAWRKEENIGVEREINSQVIREMEEGHPDTFVNRDPTKGKGLIAPRTPCPVLYGIRGDSPESVEQAHQWLQSRNDVETSLRYAIHVTNQLSDDHVYGSCSGTVLTQPEHTKGAHSNVMVFVDGNATKLVAFSEGGPVNRLLRSLNPGDRISWVGLVAPDDSIHLERLSLLDAVPRITSRPFCCGKTMRSLGSGMPIRCLECGSTSERIWLSHHHDTELFDTIEDWVEPTPSNRRHLAKPLEMGVPRS